MDEFPGNSHATKINQKQDPEKKPDASPVTGKKNLEKVISGKTTDKPKSLSKRMKCMFLAEGTNFGEHVVENVVIPMFKDMAYSIAAQIGEGIKRGVEEAIFGPDEKGRRPRTTGYVPGGRRREVNYTTYSSRSTIRRDDDRPRYRSERDRGYDRRRPAKELRQVILDSRHDGELVLEHLQAVIDDTDISYCTIGDYYSLVGENVRPIDEQWGWDDIRDARVRQIDRDEYEIVFPDPRPIEDFER